MKTFLLFLAVSLTASEKLDRTYLPPPGAKFSGGVPGNIEVPFEFPKESYSTTQRPVGILRGRPVTPEDTIIDIGINRGLGSQAPVDVDSGLISPSTKAPFEYYQKVPTTTTSYAFTQTTTHPPGEGFDTTLGSINTATGFPTTSPFVDFQTSAPGFPPALGYQPPNLIGQQPGLIPSQQPGLISSQQPGLIQSQQPGLISSQQPGLISSQQPSLIQSQQPGLIPSQQPGLISSQQPGLISSQQPGLIQSQQPGLISSQQPGLIHSQQPGLISSQQPGLISYQKPGLFPSQQPGLIQSQQPGLISSQQPDLIHSQQPGLIPSQQPGLISSQYPGSTIVTPTPDRPFVGESRPVVNQGDLNQYQTDINRPGIIPGTSTTRPGVVSQAPDKITGQYQVNQRPGVSNIGQQTTIAPSISPEGTTAGFPQYVNNLDGSLITSTPGTNIYQQGTTPGLLPSGSYDGTIENFIPSAGISQPNLTPGQQLASQGFVQPVNNIQLGQPPSQNQYQFNKDSKPGSNFPQTQLPGQQFPSQIDQFGRPVPGQEQLFSTTSPTTLIPNYSQSSGSTPGAFPTSYPAGSFPSSSIHPGISQVQPGYIRPERPQAESDRNAVILNYDNVITPDGYFAYSYDTSNGIHADESGNAADGVRANGSYSYIGDDGKLYSIVYTADENGYRPQGDHLPTPPPIPEAIQKVIDQVIRDKEAGISDDGTYDEAKYGHKKFQGGRRPSKTNKMNINETSIPDEDQFDQVDGYQQAIPHTGTRKPTSSNGDRTNKYNENINEQDQPSSVNSDNQEEGQTINKIPTRRPAYRIPGEKEEKYASDLNAGDSSDRKRPVGKIPSRRPILRTDDSSRFVDGDEDDYESEQVDKVPSRRPGHFPSRTEGEAGFQENRRRPGGKLPSRGPPDQLDDYHTYKEGNIYDKETDQSISEPNNRPADKTMLRRPTPSVSSTYDQYVKSQDSPDHNEGFINIPEEDFDDKDRQVPNRVSSRLPGTESNIVDSKLKTNLPKHHVSGIPTESQKSYDRYNQNIRRPQVTTFAPQSDDRRITLPGTVTSFDQKIRRPIMKQKPSEINQYTTDSSSNVQGPDFHSEVNDGDINVPDTTRIDQNVRRPVISQRPRPNEYITIRPSDEQESTLISQTERNPQYDDSRDTITGQISTFDQNIRRPTFTQRPGQINQYTSTTRPSIGQGTLFTPRNESEFDDSQTFVPGKIYQDISRPTSGQRPGNQNRYTTVKPIEGESGYQYLPPQRKFEDIPKSTQDADHKTYFEQKGKVSKPFMTPDVSSHEEDYDDIEENKKLPPSLRPGQKIDIGNRPVSQQDFRVYNKQNEPMFSVVTDTTPGVINDLTRNYNEPNKYSTVESTRLPSFQQKQTARPEQQFIQQYDTTATDQKGVQNIPQRTTGQQQGYFGGRDRDRTGIVPSTTPIPSQSTRFEVSQPVRKPGQQTTNRYIPETQGYNIVSTTKMPLQDSSRFEIDSTKDLYQQTPSRSPYQTTYKPMVTSSNIDADKITPGSEITSTRRPGFQTPPRRPGVYSQGQVPSTTYRPGYFTATVEGEKQPTVDEFGRPLVEFNVTPGIEGTTYRPEIGGHKGRVPFTKDHEDFKPEEADTDLGKYGRPITSEQQRKHSSFFSPYGQSSSTEKIVGEDFSGPKQQQRYDPERGYYY